MRTRRDVRFVTIIATLVMIVTVGFAARGLSWSFTVRASSVGTSTQASHFPPADQALLSQRFQQAATMLHAHRYAYAVTALREVLQLAPRLPEAHVNMGFALLGLERPADAIDFFNSALALRPTQVNAYYGLAVAYRQTGDWPAALGAMRSYVHLAQADDPFLPKARQLLGGWESQLARVSPDRAR